MYNDAYKNIAKYYDFFTNRLLTELRKQVVYICNKYSFQQILDLGCGTGNLAFQLVEDKIKTIGVDASLAMLKEAQKKILKNKTGLNFQESLNNKPIFLGSDITKLPFKDNSFDLAIISLVLHETEADIAKTIAEALRVSDYILLADYHLPERNLEVPFFYFVHFIERIAGKTHYFNFKRFMKKGGLQGLIQRICIKHNLIICEDISICYGVLGVVVLKKKA
ncbi:class I SAM-dependent methyltransferase [Desulfovibrio litoralis]|uniref:Methyltransferase domain-containing protein n=1 Tax=Desulfovibrio litoralis DSM 11393 TaxID=1121455 RepID=A0A1M7ST43_9BACT|nr:class I SAM-dependent methyltransferase [Desulfovibrio litoralis]SHN61652.1 Methyltransferase domain-containing protein [Desulfovibrio litoralis DSM 11393]